MDVVNPVNYKLHLEPDLARFTFEGKVEILCEAREPVKEISLDASELAIRRCRVPLEGEAKACAFLVDPAREELKVSLPREMKGRISLWIDYVGEINDRMVGFYRSRYVSEGNEKYIAITQFEESDARRAFPCFDHPSQKATFDVEMIIREGQAAISNGPIEEEKGLDGGRRLIRFRQTPKMSTYLLFFGVGEFEFIEDPGEVLIRLAAMPGMSKYGRFSLEFSRKSLEFSEDYYGIKFPLPKLDLIAVADFAAGAMENWGAITFRENLLLRDPEVTSKAGEQRICIVIAHEIAHQWFGNLVTPSDWKYLWLNESFATYFGYGVVEQYHPEWDLWDQFLHGQTDIALDRDALNETFPMEIPGGEHVIINAGTAPIIYNKGGSILRQVERYVGKEGFKKGLQVYLKKHEYGCAASHHLWETLEEVSAKPVGKMMKNWVEQPGFPLVSVDREGEKLLLRQQRFTYLSNESEQQWLIPIVIRLFFVQGDSKSVTALFDGKEAVIDLEPDVAAYKVNDEQSGFYRVKYQEQANLQELGKRVAMQALAGVDRWGLQNDLYALVKRGDASLEDYLDFLSYYSKEDAFLPLISIASNLHHAYLIYEGSRREKVSSAGKGLFEKVLRTIGYEPGREEKETITILRDQLIWHAVLYGSGEITEFAEAKFASLRRGEKVHPDIMKSVMHIGARLGDRETLEWFVKRLGSSESEHERLNMLTAIGHFRERDLIERVQEYILDGVPNRNKFVPIAAMAENLDAIPFLWEWYLSSLERLEAFHPVHYERFLAAIIPLAGLGREEEIKGFFHEYTAKKEKARDVIRLSLEKLEIHSRMRRS